MKIFKFYFGSRATCSHTQTIKQARYTYFYEHTNNFITYHQYYWKCRVVFKFMIIQLTFQHCGLLWGIFTSLTSPRFINFVLFHVILKCCSCKSCQQCTHSLTYGEMKANYTWPSSPHKYLKYNSEAHSLMIVPCRLFVLYIGTYHPSNITH